MADEHVPEDFFIAGDDSADQVKEDVYISSKTGQKAKKKKSGKHHERVNLVALPPQCRSEYLLDLFYRDNTGLSKLEKTQYDGFLSCNAFSHSEQPTVSKTLESFGRSGDIYKSSKIRVLIVSASALRCIEILNSFDRLRKKCTIAKLFARHMKVSEQLAFLRSRRIPIAIGTPGRLLELLQTDEELFNKLELIIMDSNRDAKLRSLLDIPETKAPLMDLIFKRLLPRIQTGTIKLQFAQ